MPAALVLTLLPWLAAQAPVDDALVRARALLAAGQGERALQLLEAERVVRPGEPAVERALAEALESVVDSGGSWLAMQDARAAWDRALSLAPEDLELQRGAIAVRLRLGEYEAALALAERALGSAWLAGGAAPPVLLELACRARLGALPPRTGSAPAARAGAVTRAWSALSHARSLAPDSPELVRLAAGLLEAEGAPERAADELVAALERSPAATELHRALIDLYVRAGIEERLGALYERWSGAGTNATLAWFTGYAWRLGGDLAQRERRFAEALTAYERAGQWMGVSATLEPAFRATADALRFQAQVSAGWCELDSGSPAALARASERLLGLLRAEPARRDELDGLGRSLMHALSALGERRVAARDFARAAQEARAIVALLPEDGTWWNNLGFLLREHATQIAAGLVPASSERESEARALQRESWRAYRRAVELLPTDVRVINDAALVQVYHLRDNLAEAEALLERAVELGEAALAALGCEPDERARFPLAQALGDAWLNLGYLHYHVYRQGARARSAFERALATDSGARPEIADYLAALDGQRGPVPEPDRGALIGPPRPDDAPEARVEPPWEASLAEARVRAEREGRALLAYHRGDGLGLDVSALDELVQGSEFAHATRGLVLVLGDAERRTFVDRRRDGRRVPCPRFGPLTCSEHRGADAELRAWLRESLGHEPGESEEGLWLWRPGSAAPERLRDLAGLAELAPSAELAPLAELAGEPFAALEASLGGEDGGSEARALVADRSLAARLALERVLWDGFRAGPARGFLLSALAEDGSASAHELLSACVRQGADSDLQRAALGVWPAGLELAPVLHVWRWSPRAEVRAAARAVLVRERPDDPALGAEALFGAR